jgi:hypothetical protein
MDKLTLQDWGVIGGITLPILTILVGVAWKMIQEHVSAEIGKAVKPINDNILIMQREVLLQSQAFTVHLADDKQFHETVDKKLDDVTETLSVIRESMASVHTELRYLRQGGRLHE